VKQVSIITVNFNQAGVTEELLSSIRTNNEYTDVEIIVVDNGSKEDVRIQLAAKFPEVKWIRSDTNLGFAGGNNLGIKQAIGAYLFLVNNDTEFTNGLLTTLVETLEQHPEVGVVSPKILYSSDRTLLQYAGFTPMNYNTGRNKCIGYRERDEGQYNNIVGQTGYAHGAAMLVRRAAVDEAGLMAENFFLYYEELDWFERIRKSGYKIWVNTNATIYHKESVSVGARSKLKEYYNTRNRILFIRRNAGIVNRTLFFLYFVLIATPIKVLQYIVNGQVKFVPLLFEAIGWNLVNGKNSFNR
jgi:GT2 family glycosyltransferase